MWCKAVRKEPAGVNDSVRVVDSRLSPWEFKQVKLGFLNQQISSNVAILDKPFFVVVCFRIDNLGKQILYFCIIFTYRNIEMYERNTYL